MKSLASGRKVSQADKVTGPTGLQVRSRWLWSGEGASAGDRAGEALEIAPCKSGCQYSVGSPKNGFARRVLAVFVCWGPCAAAFSKCCAEWPRRRCWWGSVRWWPEL